MTNSFSQRYAIVKKLLQVGNILSHDIESYLEKCKFQTQDDGGMGSFSIVGDVRRVGIRGCIDAKYIDQDGVEVVIALIVDAENYPTDVDFWKVDSSPLIEFPLPDMLQFQDSESQGDKT